MLAAPIVADTGWSLAWVVGGLSLGLLTAGVISPWVGRAIALRGGRPVLAVSAGLLAIGLLALALAHSLPAFLAAWLVIGLGMGAGLYDPAFATLGRLYGESGRSAITTLTLFGGFASTVCWPLSAFLDAHLGMARRLSGLCRLPARRRAADLSVSSAARIAAADSRTGRRQVRRRSGRHGPAAPGGGIFLLLATTITLASVISTVMSVHLLTMLQAKGLALAAAVSLGALVGPSQVTARTIEMVIARFHHPIWTKIAATSLVTAGLAALWIGGPFIVLALVLYGAGIGLESIARGTLPLAIFGPERYPVIMGRIAMPSLIAQAVAPTIGALLLKTRGPDGALAVFFAVAGCNALLVVGTADYFAGSSQSLSEAKRFVANRATGGQFLIPIKSVIKNEEGEGRDYGDTLLIPLFGRPSWVAAQPVPRRIDMRVVRS